MNIDFEKLLREAGLSDDDQATQEDAAQSKFARSIMRRSQLRELPPVLPLIEGVISRPTAAVLVGSTGAGKTFLALSMACSVGTGSSWLGRRVHQTPAMYVVGEGANGMNARVDAWEQAWGTKVGDDDVIFSVQPDSLSNMDTWVELREFALDTGRGFIVLDTFSSLAPDADETRDAPMITRRLADLATAIDGTVVLVHHPGWSDDSRVRGGYQFEANTDEVLLLRGNAQSDQIQLERKKVKEGQAGAKLWLRRRELYGSCIIESASAEDVTTPIRERVLIVLADMGETGMTGPQLLAALGLPEEKRSSLYKALRGLVDEGRVTKEGKRGHERYFLINS